MSISKDPIIIDTEGGSDFTPIPIAKAGMVGAVFAFVESIGKHEDTYQGVTKIKDYARIGWELAQKIDLPGDKYHGKPYLLTRKYTLSMHEKSGLRRMLEEWRGKKYTKAEVKQGVDLAMLIGKQCCINVVHNTASNGNTYANVGSVSGPMDGMPELKVEITELPNWIVEEKRSGGIIIPETISQPSDGETFDDVPF